MHLNIWAETAATNEQKWYESLLGAFEQKYPNIIVTTNFVDFETYRSLITIAMASDNPPDVFMQWSGAWPKYLVDQGLLEPITKFWNDNNLDTAFAPWAKALNTYNGEVYGVPVRSYTSAMWYRPDLFKKYGITPPADRWPTWDDLIGYCKTIKAQGGVAMALAGKGQWPAEYILGSIAQRMDGEQFWNDLLAGKESWKDPRVTAWFTKYAELFQAGCFYPDPNSIDYESSKDLVFDGKAVMTFILSSTPRSARIYKPDVELDFFHFPIINPATPNKMMHHETDTFFIAKASKNKEAALNWLLFMSEPDVACQLPTLTDEPPVRLGVPRSCYTNDKFGELLYNVDQDRDKYPGPISLDIGLHPEVSAEAMRQLQNFVGNPTPETITSLQAAIETVAEQVKANNTPVK
jgi:ABC-type glycerol-3-phosphate transport system substrate-binding protein